MKAILFCLFSAILIHISTLRRVKSLEKRELCTNEICENPCNGIDCNVCSNNVCCNSITCNTCVTDCSRQCKSSCCKNNCIQNCSDRPQKQSKKKCEEPEAELKEAMVTEKIFITPENKQETFNITTLINVNNVITTYNNITSPIYVNTNNINNVDLKSSDSGKIDSALDRSCGQSCSNVTYVVNETKSENCCYIMHPRTCFRDTNNTANIRCVIKTHKECSDICTSPVIMIEPQPTPQNILPFIQQQCHFVRNYPYLYCGHYSRRDCGQCYQCNGQYNSGMCYGNVECSMNCRRNINCNQHLFEGINCV